MKLQPPYLLMDSGLGDVQFTGSSAEAFLVSDKIESNNMLEVNLR